jgi:raffinose/stachyose/melibiose transport system permease protein
VTDIAPQPTTRLEQHVKRRPLRHRLARAGWAYLLLAPATLLVLVFVVYPLLASYPYTLFDWTGIGAPSRFVGVGNFLKVASDPYFWAAFRNTFTYLLMTVPAVLILSLWLAVVLNNPRLRGSALYRAAFFTPAVTSLAVVGIVVGFIYNGSSEPFSAVLRFLGLIGRTESVQILSDPRFAMPAVALVGIWHGIGFNLVYFMAALQAIPKELYEAATLDGAGPAATFWRITIPMLRQPGVVIFFLAFSGALGVFELPLVLGGSGVSGLLAGTEVVSTYIYRNAFGYGSPPNIGFASAAALFMGVITLLISVTQFALFRRLGIRQGGLGGGA